ncbi:MAG: VOC family protein [bacterium]
MTSQIDHLVLGAEDLSSATQALESDFGVPFDVGGAHPVMGTHNRLLRLQADFYLEVIAANPAGLPQRTRWFSMDDPKTKLRLSQGVHPLCWVMQVEDIHEARKNCGYDPGEVITMSRGDLEWQITVPKDGGLAEGGLLPVLIQWPGGRNPAHRLTPSPVQLIHLEITHPRPSSIEHILQRLGAPPEVNITQGNPALCFHLNTPKGSVVLKSVL